MLLPFECFNLKYSCDLSTSAKKGNISRNLSYLCIFSGEAYALRIEAKSAAVR